MIPSMTGSATGYGGLTSEFGASYYLRDANSSPFVGAGIEPRLIFSGSVINFAPYAQVGWMTSRQSNNRFLLELRVAQNIMPVENTSTCDGCTATNTNGAALPTELTLHGGMTF
jgi:hypothetical protein